MKAVLYFGFLICLLLGAAVLYELSLQPTTPTSVPVHEVVDVNSPPFGETPVATTTQTSEDDIQSASSTPAVTESEYAVLGMPFQSGGMTMRVLSVIEDSRCPSDVTCIQAGTVRVRVEFSDATGTSERTLVLHEAAEILGRMVELTEVLPRPVSTKTSAPSYQFLVEVR